MIRRLDTRVLGTAAVLRTLDRSPASVDVETRQRVSEILAAVRDRGDAALLEFTERFDRVSLTAAELAVKPAEYESALSMVGQATVDSLRYAAARIERFHRACAPQSWSMTGSCRVNGQTHSGQYR